MVLLYISNNSRQNQKAALKRTADDNNDESDEDADKDYMTMMMTMTLRLINMIMLEHFTIFMVLAQMSKSNSRTFQRL